MTTTSTFCRICEPNCPLIAEVDDDGEVVGLAPVDDHPAAGVACHKGLSFIDVHADPDRLNWPLRRTRARPAPPEFAQAEWDSSLRDIGARLREIRDKHGPNSILFFGGNPSAFDSAGLLSQAAFLRAVGTDMIFGGATQDMANKTTGAAYIYGSSASYLIPDLANTDYLLCVGSNPRVSRWTLMSQPQDNLDVVKQIVDRGGKVRFVNPRDIESSMAETGPTLRIKPGADVYFLAALIHELGALEGFDDELVQRYGKRFDALLDFADSYPPERVEHVTGISARQTKEIAAEIVAAPSAVVYISTGVNQSRQGLLAYWLAEMINFVTGNLGRNGGTFKPAGLQDHCAPTVGTKVVNTSVGKLELPDPIGYSKLPAVLLADLIESGDVRAVITWYSNPLLTIGGEDRVRSAFEKLDLLVSFDIYRSLTADLADYVLPGTDWLERPDINMTATHAGQPVPHVMYSDAVVKPEHDRRHSWWALARVVQEMGLPSLLDARTSDHDPMDPTFLFDEVLAARSLTVEQVRSSAWNTVLIDENPKDSLFEQCLQHPDHLIDCCPPAFRDAGLFTRCAEIFDELLREPDGTLKLISLRTKYMQNSSFVNIRRFRRGRNSDNPLHMCEEDAVARGLFDGDRIRIWNEHGQIESRVVIDDSLRPGAVAMSHGYGNSRADALKVASQKAGANCNVLMPTGPGSYEPLSFMSWISAVPVDVSALREPRVPVEPRSDREQERGGHSRS